MTSIIILVIAVLAPWMIHLAPPRQRALAMVLVVALLLLVGIFSQNPIVTWQFWVGLAAGILTVAGVAMLGDGHGGPDRRTRKRRANRSDPSTEQTGEI